jgi:hypothetical protein
VDRVFASLRMLRDMGRMYLKFETGLSEQIAAAR